MILWDYAISPKDPRWQPSPKDHADQCQIQERQGTSYICTRRKGHDGHHMAHNPQGWVVAIFEPEPPEVPNAA